MEFNYSSGDLIGLIQKDIQVMLVVEKYPFSHYVNLGNVLERVGDEFMLGYLADQKHSIVANVVQRQSNPSSQETGLTRLAREGDFIEEVARKPLPEREAEQGQEKFFLAHSFMVKNKLLLSSSRNANYDNLLTGRIRYQLLENKAYNFERTFADILYSPLTALMRIP